MTTLQLAVLLQQRGNMQSVAQRIRAVLLDALGTLLTFEPPAPHLRDGAARAPRGRGVRGGRRRRDPGRDRLLPRAPARGPRRGLAGRPAAPVGRGDAARARRRRRPHRRPARLAAVRRLPGRRARAARAARARAAPRGGVQLGRLAARAPARDRPGAAGRRRGGVGGAGPRQARPRHLRPRARARRRAAGRRRCTPATRRTPTWPERWPPGLRAVLVARDGGPPARRRACPWCARSPSCPRCANTLEGPHDQRPVLLLASRCSAASPGAAGGGDAAGRAGRARAARPRACRCGRRSRPRWPR